MSESRFQRIEDKVDRLDDKVDNLKVDMAEMRSDIKNHTKVIESHILGDNKIIDKIIPMLDDLSEVANIHRFKKQKETDKMGKLKKYSITLGIISLTLGIVFTASRLFGLS